jgi:transcriptional regulator with XRE-family HTH domain
LSGTDFAAVVGVDKSTVSRWESRADPAPMSPQSERLLRVLVLSGKSVRSDGLEECGRAAPSSTGLLFAHDSGRWRAAV